ncbi:Rhs element Vgr protein [Pricia antarctica]|uniref:Rhs element Vgr protein n=1 Tax=Pricia antarctica TaxID=641691 RepID=A0A1G6YSQ4_9FLAO|nr:type VI secretion system tip protein VgrG [Pricia antarctica]SDD93398.1 Rhs element Vgr protein [Pricia antarctica]
MSARLIPTPVAPSVSTFTILSDGEVVSAQYQVMSVLVYRSVNRIPSATLVIKDGDAAAQIWEVSETDYFIPGKPIEIRAGYQGTEDTIYKGIVVSHSIKVREQRSVLRIDCRDEAYKMTLRPQSRFFREQSDSDVIEDMVSRAGLQSEVEATTFTHGELVQYNCTDWDFILTRTDAMGKICVVEDGTLKINKPDLEQSASLDLEYGATILNFDAEIDSRNQFEAIESMAWNPADQEIRSVEESNFNSPQVGNLTAETLAATHAQNPFRQQHGGPLLEEELKDWSVARLQKSRLARIRGRAQFQGIASILPGQVIKLAGVGERFNGEVFVAAVRHEIGNGNWLTDVEFGLDDDWFTERFSITQARAASLIPAATGLQIGIVTQLADDPLGEHRVMIRLPILSTEDEGVWARIATLDAGENRGSFFRPGIGDEVVVHFLNNDPRYPIILGALNSSAKPAPIDATDENFEKGFVTESGMQLLFNDEYKNILLETPDGNRVAISGENQSITIEDQNSNKIVMDTSGITIESAKDIVLKANTKLEASAPEVKIEGSATAEFSASGTNTIKGGLVQIN